MSELDKYDVKEFFDELDRAVSELSAIQLLVFVTHARNQWTPERIAQHLKSLPIGESEVKRELESVYSDIRRRLIERFGPDGFTDFQRNREALRQYARRYLL